MRIPCEQIKFIMVWNCKCCLAFIKDTLKMLGVSRNALKEVNQS